MLSTKIKEATHTAHQQLEKKVVSRLKAIRSDADYAAILKYFYAYFYALEKVVTPYITASVLPNVGQRRDTSYLKRDIEELGSDVNNLSPVNLPAINNIVDAMGALYVMEGSIMGGPYIVQMLQKSGINKGFSFFSGYGQNTGEMWGVFTAALNSIAATDIEETAAIAVANQTFVNFSNMFVNETIKTEA